MSDLFKVSFNSDTSATAQMDNLKMDDSDKNESNNFDISFNLNNSMPIYVVEPSIQCNSKQSNSINTQTERLMTHFLKFNQSYNSLESMAQIMNLMDDASIKIPESKYRIIKQIDPQFKIELHIYCANCKKYTPTTVPTVSCQTCTKQLKTAHSNYFVYIPIEQQLRKVIDEHWDEITSYPNSPNDKNVMKDIYDSIIYKKVKAKYESCCVLSLVGSTDGAKVFENNSKSLWAIQIYQNYLHPSMRYVPNNIMCVAFHCDSKKPDMRSFFLPLLKELKSIKSAGGIVMEKNGCKKRFMPLMTHFVADSPAKCDVQEMVTCAGYKSCSYCLHPGIQIKGKTTMQKSKSSSYVRYIRRGTPDPLRTHEETLKTYQKLKHTFTRTPIDGIKEISCMVAAIEFDLINGYAIDYMHCVLEGAMKKLLCLWLDSVNHKENYYIKPKEQQLLSKRITSIKPIKEIFRKPGPVSQRSEYKANELRTLLLYYLRYSLTGLLDKRYIDNFQLLSASIYTLLKDTILAEEIDQAETQLNEFADKFEHLYGQHNITMNIHLLRHLGNAVRQLGPLWAQSSFALEANNGIITKTSAKKSILQSVALKYNIRCSLSKLEGRINDIILKGKVKINLTTSEHDVLKISGFEHTVIFYDKIIFQKKELTSQKSKDVATVDYFVKMKNNQFGAVRFFFVSNHVVHAFVHLHEVIDVENHLLIVQPSQENKIFNMRDFKTKLLFMKIGSRDVVTERPNMYEKT